MEILANSTDTMREEEKSEHVRRTHIMAKTKKSIHSHKISNKPTTQNEEDEQQIKAVRFHLAYLNHAHEHIKRKFNQFKQQ